jgi:hypothetical protein
VAALFVSQAPVRVMIGQLADALHSHVDERMGDYPVQAVAELLTDGSAYLPLLCES